MLSFARRVCVCVCVRARKRQLQCRVCVCSCVCAMRETRSCKHGLFANTYELHYGVCQVTQFPFRAWTCGKTGLYFSFESWRSRFWKGELHFRRVLVVFGQSQCTVSVGHSEQTVLVGRRDFVENEACEAGHRGPTIMYSIWKIMCFLNIKACQHILLNQIHKIVIFKKVSYVPFKINVLWVWYNMRVSTWQDHWTNLIQYIFNLFNSILWWQNVIWEMHWPSV